MDAEGGRWGKGREMTRIERGRVECKSDWIHDKLL